MLGQLIRPCFYQACVVCVGLSLVASTPMPTYGQGVAIAPSAPAARASAFGHAFELSAAFQHVASTLRPSVVSINSSIQPREITGRGRQIPRGLEEFFGDDLGRFFELDPRQLPRREGMGTGIVITSDGYILTNTHVVQGADEVIVKLADERKFRADVVGADESTDVAVLKVDANGLVPARLGNSDQIEVGQWVLAIGNALGLDQTVTAGIVSARGRANLDITRYEDFIQTDAAINPGNSGGPLVNLRGEVVGLNTAIASRTGGYMGVGFAIPINMARQVKDALIQDGRFARAWLGAGIQDLDVELAQAMNATVQDGVIITQIWPDSPAEAAGLQPEDIVVAIDGRPTNSANELRNRVAFSSPTAVVRLSVVRGSRKLELPVTLGEFDDARVENASQESPVESPTTDNQLGISTRTLTPEIARELRLDGASSGVLVVQVAPQSLADRAGIRRGDLIVKVDDHSIESVQEFEQAAGTADLERGMRLSVVRNGFARFVVLRSRR